MSNLIKVINDPHNGIERILNRLESAGNTSFLLCLGSTMTSDLEGISAAGATAADRRLTPRFDAEALMLGRTADGSNIPVSPFGIASPVVLTRACLDILKSERLIIDCGTFAPPRVEKIQVGTLPAQCVSSGNALPLDHVYDLFERGLKIGARAAAGKQAVIIAECVPGGTTTAMAVLTGLGNRVSDFISSSIPAGEKEMDNKRRFMLVNEGLEKAGLKSEKKILEELDPFILLSKVGDPMQPVAAGCAIGAAATATVVLAGGSQMLAVHEVAEKIAASMKEENQKNFKENCLVITTRWVAYDPKADTPALAKALDAPLACTTFSLGESIHDGLKAYEEGHVKEGVGAGASIALANLIEKSDQKTLLDAIDRSYSSLVSPGDSA
ncbi:MAG: TIGR00303 family protein [Cyanobacteriota/Melainabacteria group bacterium]